MIGLHLGRHLEYMEMLNDARVASFGFFKENICTTRINKEKKFKIKFQVLLKFAQILLDYHQSVKQFGSRPRPRFCWSLSGFKLFAKGYLQTTKLSTGMQRVITGKYFSVQYIVSYKDIHVYVYHTYSDTLNTFNMLCPLNKARVIFKGSS